MSSISVQNLPAGVAVVKFDVPGEKLNVLSTQFMLELDATLDQLTEQATAGTLTGVVFISGKEDSFFAGANLEEILALQKMPQADGYKGAVQGRTVFAKIAALPVPTVCAINGICLGGGTELALACKYRLASDSPKTKLGLPEVGLGFLPGWGGTVRLTKLCGAQAAMDLILQPLKSWESKKAWVNGLVDEVVSTDKLLERAIQVAQFEKSTLFVGPRRAKPRLMQRVVRGLLECKPNVKAQSAMALAVLLTGWFFCGWLGFLGCALGAVALFAPQITRQLIGSIAAKTVYAGTRGNYPAPPAALKVILATLTQPEAKVFEMESQTFARLATTPESRALVGIFFATTESKKAPSGAKPSEVKTVGVLGAGVMGAGIAQAALYSGFSVVLYDKFAEGLERGLKTIKELFDGLVEKKKMTRGEADAKLAKLVTTTDYSKLAVCELVVEAIIEDMKVKKGAIAELEKVMVSNPSNLPVQGMVQFGGDSGKPEPRRFIFATNTSSLSVGEMGADARNPGDVGGLHFFNPVHKMPLVEVVAAEKTAPETIATLKAFAAKLGKTTVTTTDAPGFVVNRILAPYLYEAIRMMELGVPLADIEDAMKRFGMPMGPLALLDEVGLDICSKVIHVLHDALGARLTPPAILEFIKTSKLTGKKGGKGIYLYDKDGKRLGFNPEFVAALPKQAGVSQKSRGDRRGEIQDRLALVMINEAARVLAEGVVSDVSQLDLAMVMGTGFPPFRGGVLRYADTLGVRTVVQKLEWLAKVSGDNYVPAPLLVKKAERGDSFYAA